MDASLRSEIPFDHALLDRLMDEAGIDVILATSKHNVQYLLGGHRALFFDYMDAIGISRYLPVVVYPKGAPDKAAFFGHRLEQHQCAVETFWISDVRAVSWGSVDAVERAAAYLRDLGLERATIAVEMPFLPADSYLALRNAAPSSQISDALLVLERVRARKTARELALVREASERVESAMMAVIRAHGPGTTKRELAEALRREETERGLVFEYCLIAAGSSFNRAPSDQQWQRGDVLSVDSGGNYQGYIGDIARMAIIGDPDRELDDLLACIDRIQAAAIAAVAPGVPGRQIYDAANAAMSETEHRDTIHFVAHGMGLITHEAPRLTDRATANYPATHADVPLETGMVISIETTLPHPRRGFIKLEDTVAVSDSGSVLFAAQNRGWNRAGRD
jgi:Xaa-Pro aminopeptidase